MQERHKQEVAALQGDDEQPESADKNTATETPPEEEEEEDPGKAARERKQAKARRKREAQRQKQKELDEERERDLAGPSARTDEMNILKTKLNPLSLKIETVAADGHCLYRAVAAQCDDMEYSRMRESLVVCWLHNEMNACYRAL